MNAITRQNNEKRPCQHAHQDRQNSAGPQHGCLVQTSGAHQADGAGGQIMPTYNCYKCKYCQLGYCKQFGFKVFTTSELCYRYKPIALSESEQKHLEA